MIGARRTSRIAPGEHEPDDRPDREGHRCADDAQASFAQVIRERQTTARRGGDGGHDGARSATVTLGVSTAAAAGGRPGLVLLGLDDFGLEDANGFADALGERGELRRAEDEKDDRQDDQRRASR